MWSTFIKFNHFLRVFSFPFKGVFIAFDDEQIYTYVYSRESVSGKPTNISKFRG